MLEHLTAVTAAAAAAQQPRFHTFLFGVRADPVQGCQFCGGLRAASSRTRATWLLLSSWPEPVRFAIEWRLNSLIQLSR